MTRALASSRPDALRAQIPLGRLGQSSRTSRGCGGVPRIAAGGYITGATLHVNGGMYMD